MTERGPILPEPLQPAVKPELGALHFHNAMITVVEGYGAALRDKQREVDALRAQLAASAAAVDLLSAECRKLRATPLEQRFTTDP
jgi:hypothetical protein